MRLVQLELGNTLRSEAIAGHIHVVVQRCRMLMLRKEQYALGCRVDRLCVIPVGVDQGALCGTPPQTPHMAPAQQQLQQHTA